MPSLVELLGSGDYKKAYPITIDLAERFPTNNTAACLKGYVEFKLNKCKDAKATLMQVINRKPTHHEANKYLGEISLQESDFNLALAYFEISYKAKISDHACLKLFELNYFFGNVAEAKKYAYTQDLKNMVDNLEKEELENINKKEIQDTHEINTENTNIGNLSGENKDAQFIKDIIANYNFNNRAECMDIVYSMINDGNLIMAFEILKKCFNKTNKREVIENLISLEMIDLLTALLEKLYSMNLCSAAFNIGNVILSIFSKHKKTHYGALSFLIQVKKYGQINKIGYKYLFGNKSYIKATEIIDKIRQRHPNINNKSERCDCNILPVNLKFLKGFTVEKDYMFQLLFR